MFFTASAPLVGKHINVSPKGLPSATFSIFDGNHAGYVDHSGSGSETISHIYENGRVTIMFCSFGSNPRIMRLFCTGRVVEADQPDFAIWLDRMGKSNFEGARAVILLDIFKVQTSCGFGVPLLDDGGADRDTLDKVASQFVKKGRLKSYQVEHNARSLDGLGGMKVARKNSGEVLWIEDWKIWWNRVKYQRDAMCVGALLTVVTYLIFCYVTRILARAWSL